MAVAGVAGSVALLGAGLLESLGLGEAIGGAVALGTGSEALGALKL